MRHEIGGCVGYKQQACTHKQDEDGGNEAEARVAPFHTISYVVKRMMRPGRVIISEWNNKKTCLGVWTSHPILELGTG